MISTSPGSRARRARVGRTTLGHYRSWRLICCRNRVYVGRSLAAIDTKPNRSHGVSSAYVSLQPKTRTARTTPWNHIPCTSGLRIGRPPFILKRDSSGRNTTIPTLLWLTRTRGPSPALSISTGWIGTTNNSQNVLRVVERRWRSCGAGMPRIYLKSLDCIKSQKIIRCSRVWYQCTNLL